MDPAKWPGSKWRCFSVLLSYKTTQFSWVLSYESYLSLHSLQIHTSYVQSRLKSAGMVSLLLLQRGPVLGSILDF